MAIVETYLIPIIKLSFYLGIFGFIAYIVVKAFRNGWIKEYKFVWKYKIRKKKLPDKTVKWILECMENGIGWYDAKKLLMVKDHPQSQINEILWIYDALITELDKNTEKGGKKTHGRKYTRSDRKDEINNTELPSF